MTKAATPKTQRAVQLVGPDQLKVNEAKEIFEPGEHQVLCRVEVCGLCFSDLKLLKQFSGHARKSEIKQGVDPLALGEMPNYVPGVKPVVPGHETVVRIARVGPKVVRYKVGERYLVQTDYRWLPTANSNAAFGYNFEGALQEFVLLDERVITAPDGESMLIPAPDDLGASAIALVEPWACVEDAYRDCQRRVLKDGGRALVVGEAPVEPGRIRGLAGKPAQVAFTTADRLAEHPDGAHDDVIYFGANPQTAEKLWAKAAAGGLVILVQDGAKFGRPVVTAVGRVHYGGIRIAGTAGGDPAAALSAIPETAEIRRGDKINIVGAAGPMGTMHVIRDLCQGVPGITVYAGDMNDDRLAALRRLAEPIASQNKASLSVYQSQREKPKCAFDYVVLMAPVPALVAEAVRDAAPRAIINIFAGIPANVTAEIDLDLYISMQAYFVGTSGSTLDDMKAVLKKVTDRQLDTNLSVAAISGLEGAIDGIRAVEKNLMPGKIVVYPFAKGLKLTALTDMALLHPAVARALSGGRWNLEAEAALKKEYPAQ
ncbi:MAG TPA: alcohol dehydrogenase catalytic domain-containing protein [Opitutaceae bacterium]|nr:alcohol dehydrogenase catalytic domain-containing protein [Opitutaceae bacterium]